jgi:hypothetical protein
MAKCSVDVFQSAGYIEASSRIDTTAVMVLQ